jgi:hypothetical protein
MEQQFHYSTRTGIRPVDGISHYNNVIIGLDQYDKCQMALKKLFIPTIFTDDIPAFRSLNEAYVHFTGDSDISGVFRPDKISKDLRACQDFNSGSFSYALQNALNVFLTKMYREFPFHEDILISDKNSVDNFRKIHSVQFGYFGELPDIDPETADFADMEPFSDGQTDYSLSQKGAVIWVTRKMIVNDNIGVIQAMTKRLARAARVAHAKYLWNFFIKNVLCPDGTAWFTAGHGNLTTAALDISPLVTAIKALANMTEPGPSTEKIGLDLATFNWKLVIPINIWDTAVKKNQCDSVFISNDLTTKDPNPCQELFGENNERIITCPFITNETQWGLIRDCQEVPIIEMSYLNGHEEPELFTSSSPASGGIYIFANDKLGYKIRHEYGGALVDYKGGYCSITP